MMNNEEKWGSAIERMTKQTVKREIKWAPSVEARQYCTQGQRLIGVPYICQLLGKTFMVYQYEYRYYHDVDEWSNVDDVSIEIVDANWNLAYRVPSVPERWKLIEAIREQVTGAEDFLSDFLEE